MIKVKRHEDKRYSLWPKQLVYTIPGGLFWCKSEGTLICYLIVPGTWVPKGTGPLVGSTKRPLEFWTLSLRKMDTWYTKKTVKSEENAWRNNRMNRMDGRELTLICMSWKKIRRVCLINWKSPLVMGVYIWKPKQIRRKCRNGTDIVLYRVFSTLVYLD